jgi:membrane protein DedA with SNARE-associated domain
MNDIAGRSHQDESRKGRLGPPVAWWHWHRRLYNWVIHWADTRYGVLALIILAISEPICVPIPADIMVIGLCLGKPKHSLRYGFLCSFISVLGGTIAFSLGLAIGGERVIRFCEWISPFFAQLTFGLFNFVSIVFRTMRFGSQGVLFYFLGERARRLIEKYFNIATVIVIILLVLLAYIMKKLGHIFMVG